MRPRSPLLFLSGSELDRVVWDDGLYELLDVAPTATSEEIARAYRAKAKMCHPDLHQGDARRADIMVRLNRARDLLSSDTLRLAYDWLRYEPRSA
jgi:molecular chaperone DnaJ